MAQTQVVTAVHWLPHRRGAIAVAIGEPGTLNEHAARSAHDSYILVWSARDPIHPEYVLECPNQVMAFSMNPGNPAMVAAGCYNGQVRVAHGTYSSRLCPRGCLGRMAAGLAGPGRGARADSQAGRMCRLQRQL
jgi:hypothetical protein